jgi:hypothetical protein
LARLRLRSELEPSEDVLDTVLTDRAPSSSDWGKAGLLIRKHDHYHASEGD